MGNNYGGGRNVTLDVAKGISILLMTLTHLVVFNGHPGIKSFNSEVLMIFKMPLFIFVSGYLFSGERGFKEFIKKKFDGLVKPVVTILFLSAIVISGVWILGGGEVHAAFGHVRNVLSLYYIPLWFPVTLFLSLIAFKVLLSVWRADKSYSLPGCMAIVVLLAIASRSGADLYILKFHAILYFMIFLAAGYLVRKRDMLEGLLNFRSFISFVSIFILSIVLKGYLGIGLDLNANIFGDFITTVIASFSGVIILVNISKWLAGIKYVSSILAACSRSSFYILAFSLLLGNDIIYPLIVRFLPLNILSEVLCFVAVIGACIFLHKAVLRTKYLKYLMLPAKSFVAQHMSAGMSR